VPSLAIDLARGHETEIAYLNGAVVRRGVRHGIATPVNGAIVTLIEFLATRGAA
jgi:2-dehydropantoate 2-reductase